MGSSVYVASFEGYTGKSTVALGLLEQLSRILMLFAAAATPAAASTST